MGLLCTTCNSHRGTKYWTWLLYTTRNRPTIPIFFLFSCIYSRNLSCLDKGFFWWWQWFHLVSLTLVHQIQILHLLYDKEIIQEEAILSWASEKEEAEESDKVFVKKCEKFIRVSILLHLFIFFIYLYHLYGTI